MAVTPPVDFGPFSAGIFVFEGESMRSYDKKPRPLADLADKLIADGLSADRDSLLSILHAVGYYRFKGYLLPFRNPSDGRILPGTTLDEVWHIYTFDRHLRLLAMDALARIEVAIRAQIVEFHTESDPDPFAYTKAAQMPGLTAAQHASLLSHIKSSIDNSRDEPDIAHLRAEYGIEDFPPIWNLMEHVAMGSVTFYVKGLPIVVRQRLANTYGVIPKVFDGFLMALKAMRNICAHHSRLWNRHLRSRLSPNIGDNPLTTSLIECLSCQPSRVYTSTFSMLSLCAHCLGIIRPTSQWKSRCKELLREATPFVLRGMGVPADWEQLALWR